MPSLNKQIAEELAKLKVEADVVAANPRSTPTEEGLMLLTMHRRLVETLVDGKPLTPMPTRNHG